MKKVMQYLLKDTNLQNLILPIGSKILSIQDLNGEPTIFALTDMDQKQEEVRVLYRVRTGVPVINDVAGFKYLGSVLVHSFGYAYHVFENEKEVHSIQPVEPEPPKAEVTVETTVELPVQEEVVTKPSPVDGLAVRYRR